MVLKGLFLCFLIVASCQDLKWKQVNLNVYLTFGLLAITYLCWRWLDASVAPDFADIFCGICLGAGILGLNMLWKDAIGQGDGFFFLVSSWMLGFWENVAVFLYGLLLCGAFSLGYLVWQQVHGVQGASRQTVPFLPFLVPAAIWIVSR